MVTTVQIDGVAATDVTVTDETTLTAVVPEGTAAGPVDVTVSTSTGTDTLTGGYEYIAKPTFTSSDPDHGPVSGGTTVTVTGTGFIEGGTSVTVDINPAQDVVVNSDTELTFVTPPAFEGVAQAVMVEIRTVGGFVIYEFTYDPDVAVTGIDPASGPVAGANTVTITGAGFEMP